MIKIIDYIVFGKPIVQYDLKEGRYSAQEASLYAECTSTRDFAEKIIQLLDHTELRSKMSEFGYERVIRELSWDHEHKQLVSIYSRILGV